jgi:hypothetical protein
MVSFVPGGSQARLRLSAGRVARMVHSFPSNLQTTLKTGDMRHAAQGNWGHRTSAVGD